MLHDALQLATLEQVVFALMLVGVSAGVGLEKLRVQVGRTAYRSKRGSRGKADGFKRPWKNSAPRAVTPPIHDAAHQLRVVMAASFEARRLLNKSEARVFYAAERAIAAEGVKWRVMAQVNLGEILSSPDANAFAAINSKRVDMLIISQTGDPIAAIEYQGEGHYQGTAPARDAVKKEALRKAGVRYIEVTPEHGPDDVQREIARLSAADRGKTAA